MTTELSPELAFDRFEQWLNGKDQQRLGFPTIQASSELLVIRRTGALGDVLAATYVAKALTDQGYTVEWQAHKACHALLRRMPHVIKRYSEPDTQPDVDLDGAYETHPERCTRHFADLFTERANEQLEKRGIAIEQTVNVAPTMERDEKLSKALRKEIKDYVRPWVMIVPRSNSWVNRTVPDAIWNDAASMIDGTCFWLGNHGPAPLNIVDLKCREVDDLIEWIGLADLLLTVDSGPCHIAAALRVEQIIIEQASTPDVHLSNQRPWEKLSPPLECLNCQATCKFDAATPPCQTIDPLALALMANKKLRSIQTEDISAVIVLYKPDVAKLLRCLKCVLPQVEEVILACDLDTPMLSLPDNPKIRLVRMMQHETGYGRKATFGARHSNGKYIWFVNDDLYPNADCAEKMMEVMRTDEKLGAVTHKLLYPNGTVQYAGMGRPAGHIGFGHIDHKQRTSRITKPTEMEAVCGASMLTRRKVLFEVGAFDESLVLYSEDTWYSMAVRQAGYKLFYTPHAEGVHEEHQSVNKRSGVERIRQESAEIFRTKWEPYFRHNPDVNKLGNFDYLKK
jgi:GT2 family glycosyltransferase/ADP-heptose:LPS heptosyltransferase